MNKQIQVFSIPASLEVSSSRMSVPRVKPLWFDAMMHAAQSRRVALLREIAIRREFNHRSMTPTIRAGFPLFAFPSRFFSPAFVEAISLRMALRIVWRTEMPRRTATPLEVKGQCSQPDHLITFPG